MCSERDPGSIDGISLFAMQLMGQFLSISSIHELTISQYRNGMDCKITATKPGLWLEFWYRTRKADYRNYIQTGGEPLKNATSALTQFTLLVAAGAVALSAYRMNVLA